METPKPEPVSPVRIPEHGPPMTEERKAAWTALDIAAWVVQRDPLNPSKVAVHRRAIENYDRVYAELEEQGRRSRTLE